jgi:hypothetical protein
MSNRGIPASILHNVYKHYYITVDTTATNYRPYLLDKINHLKSPGILHVMKHGSNEEIERIMV